jgi:hypothetical protein
MGPRTRHRAARVKAKTREFLRPFLKNPRTNETVMEIIRAIRYNIPHRNLTRQELERTALSRTPEKILRAGKIDKQILCFNETALAQTMLRALGYRTRYVTAVTDTRTLSGIFGLHSYLEFRADENSEWDHIDFSTHRIYKGPVRNLLHLIRVFEGKHPADLGIKTYSDFEKLADERSLRKFIELTLKLDSRGRVLETDHYLRMLTNVTNLEGKRIVVQQLLELMKQGASFTKKERNLIMTEAGKLGLK